MRTIFLLLLLLLPASAALTAQSAAPNPDDFLLLLDSGRKQNGLPVMVRLSDGDPRTTRLRALLDSTFMGQAVRIFHRAQAFRMQVGHPGDRAPAVLALTPNEGGFARLGFHLEGDGDDHSATPYVDVTASRLEQDPARLMALPQLYTHELGHVIYRMLSRTEEEGELGKGSSIHYFPIVTDYQTAFNEGFAEHLENIARQFDPDSAIRAGIRSDLDRIGKRAPLYAAGFEKDLRLPGRLGLYKVSLPVWYQQFENYRRSEQARSGVIRFASRSLTGGTAEDRITFRNSGLRLDTTRVKTPDQLMATEGFVNAFFTRLSTSAQGARTLPDSLSQCFLLPGESPQAIASLPPWHRQLLKYWVVFDQHLSDARSGKPPFVQFMEGYSRCFPEEKQDLLRIFREVAGFDYPGKAAPELWMLVRDHRHRILLIDAFDAITLPFYTFNLNTAGMEDLLAIPGLSSAGAGTVLAYLDRMGGLAALSDLQKAPGLAESDLQALLACTFDQAYYDSVSEPELNIRALIATPLKMLLLHALAAFIALALILWLVFLRREKSPAAAVLLWSLRMLGLWLFLVAGGLAALLISSQPLATALALPLSLTLLDAWRLRKRPARRNAALGFYFGAALILCWSLWT